jgi:hypothetical protein
MRKLLLIATIVSNVIALYAYERDLLWCCDSIAEITIGFKNKNGVRSR